MNVVCYGDSNTYGFDPRSYFGSRYSNQCRWPDILAAKTGWVIYNCGENGRCVPNTREYFPDGMDLLIIMLGTNDLLQGKTHDNIAERMKKFLVTISCSYILLISPPILQIGDWVRERDLIEESAMLTDAYKELSVEKNILYANADNWNIELTFDGVHFSENGHRAFADGLYDYLMHIGLIQF